MTEQSLRSYHEGKQRRMTQRERALHLIYEEGSITYLRLGELTGWKSPWARISELESLGLVYTPKGAVVHTDTQPTSIWHLTEKGKAVVRGDIPMPSISKGSNKWKRSEALILLRDALRYWYDAPPEWNERAKAVLED